MPRSYRGSGSDYGSSVAARSAEVEEVLEHAAALLLRLPVGEVGPALAVAVAVGAADLALEVVLGGALLLDDLVQLPAVEPDAAARWAGVDVDAAPLDPAELSRIDRAEAVFGHAATLAKDQAGGGAVRKQLARAVGDPALGGRDARARVQDRALAPHDSGVGEDRPDEVRLHLERRVADSGLEQRVDGAAHRRVEQRQGDGAVHGADR